MEYTTKDGEILDVICQQTYGTTGKSFGQVLFSPENYDVTTCDVFSAGAVITLPHMKPETRKTDTMLWE